MTYHRNMSINYTYYVDVSDITVEESNSEGDWNSVSLIA